MKPTEPNGASIFDAINSFYLSLLWQRHKSRLGESAYAELCQLNCEYWCHIDNILYEGGLNHLNKNGLRDAFLCIRYTQLSVQEVKKVGLLELDSDRLRVLRDVLKLMRKSDVEDVNTTSMLTNLSMPQLEMIGNILLGTPQYIKLKWLYDSFEIPLDSLLNKIDGLQIIEYLFGQSDVFEKICRKGPSVLLDKTTEELCQLARRSQLSNQGKEVRSTSQPSFHQPKNAYLLSQFYKSRCNTPFIPRVNRAKIASPAI